MEDERRWFSRTSLPLLLAAGMAGAAVLLAVPGILADPAAAEPDLWWIGVLPLFAVAEVAVIHLPTQRNAHGHTLREIPAVLGLTFLAPQQYVSAYVVGTVLALVFVTRMRGVKLAFNAAMFALEAALGAMAYHQILGGGDPLSPLGWVAVIAAVLLTDLLSAAAVTAAISLTEGAFDGEVLGEALRSGLIAAFINACVALLVATLVLVQPSALPLLAVLIVLLALGYRVYVSLARGHAQTRLLYRFVDRTSSALSAEDLVETVLVEAADLMHAEHAFLVEVAGSDEVVVHRLEEGTHHVEPLPAVPADLWWWGALRTDEVQLVRPRGTEPAAPAEDGGTPLTTPRDGLAARLRGDGPTRHVLVVCDRTFDKETFGTEDVEAFAALAAHAGIALERTRSVSDLARLADELAVARDAALAASEAKSLFLANVSHELRTPLTTMLASAEMLEDTDLDDLQRDLLERVSRQGGALRTLVEAILDFSRVETGQLRVDPQLLDLHALVTGLADTYEQRAAERGLVLRRHLDPRVPRVVVGDRARIAQVLGNLLDNALKFTHHGEIGLAVWPLPDGGVELVVHDTGIGIAPVDLPSVFEAFTQVDGSATRHYEGTGLGLAICKRLTELMGGTIEVESQPGAGSTFAVQLPLAEAKPEVAPRHALGLALGGAA